MGVSQVVLRVPGVLDTNQTLTDLITTLIAKYGGVTWPTQEESGTQIVSDPVGYEGTYANVTLNQALNDELGVGVLFDGSTSYANIYSSAFNTLFDPDQGTLVIFFKVSDADVWSDEANRYLVRLRVNNQNRIYMLKNSAGNLEWRYEAGDNAEQETYTTTSTDVIMMAMTWDVNAGASNGEVKYYINGVQQGATDTDLGTWVGNLGSTVTCFGAGSTPANVFDGYCSHPLLLTDVATTAELLKLAQLAGL